MWSAGTVLGASSWSDTLRGRGYRVVDDGGDTGPPLVLVSTRARTAEGSRTDANHDDADNMTSGHSVDPKTKSLAWQVLLRPVIDADPLWEGEKLSAAQPTVSTHPGKDQQQHEGDMVTQAGTLSAGHDGDGIVVEVDGDAGTCNDDDSAGGRQHVGTAGSGRANTG